MKVLSEPFKVFSKGHVAGFEFQFIFKALSNFGSCQMYDNGMIGAKNKVGGKRKFRENPRTTKLTWYKQLNFSLEVTRFV